VGLRDAGRGQMGSVGQACGPPLRIKMISEIPLSIFQSTQKGK
jgi:hypothetical protein